MKSPGRGRIVLLVLLLVLLTGVPAAFAATKQHSSSPELYISNQVSGEIYLTADCKPGDQLIFGWEHSFEHVTWNEYYTILEDGTLKLNSIAVGGFGAGIPAEMDCTYRFEDGLIYMEDLGESEFPELTWIHSQKQVKFIELNGETLATGPDLPQRAKIRLKIS